MHDEDTSNVVETETAPSATAGKTRPLPRTVILLGVTSFFTDIGSEMIFPLLPVYLASLGAAPAFLGLIEGLADATSSLLQLASGYVADRRRQKKPLVLLGYGVAGLARPLVALATAPWHVLAVRVTDRVGKGIRSAPRDALIASSVDATESGRAFGFHRAMDHAGAVIGPLVATALLGLGWELRAVFAAAFVPGFLALFAVAVVRERSWSPSPTTPTSNAPVIGTKVAPSGALRSYLIILAAFSLGASSDAFLLLRARELGVPVVTLPLLWTTLHIAKVASAFVGGRWADRVARHKLIVAGWSVYALTYLAFGFATQPWHAWILFLVYGSYYGLTEPAEKALIRDLAPEGLRGRAFGYFNFVIGVMAIPAGLLTGFLWQRWSPQVALTTGAMIATAASLALMHWSRRHMA